MKLDELTENLKELRLYGMLANFAEAGRIAEKERKTYEQYLGQLSKLEVELRKEQKVKNLIKESKLPIHKN